MQGSISMAGTLTTKVKRAQKAPLPWRLKNGLRWRFIKGWIAKFLVAPFANTWGVCTITSELAIELRKASGEWIDYGVVSYRVVTDAGVAFLVDDWDNDAADITTMHFHGAGIDDTPGEAVGDVALQSECTAVLNPDNTRATGTESQPAANQLRTVGTLTFDGVAAVVEHGLFSQAATGGGTLWDRSTFAAINVAGGDSIQFTYTCTIASGG